LVAYQRADISRDFLLTPSLTHNVLASLKLVNTCWLSTQVTPGCGF
jgi:hypothetical protein